MFDRVRRRLLGWTMLVLALILLLVGATVYLSQRRSLTAQVDNDLAAQLRGVVERHGRVDVNRIAPGGYRGGLFYLLAAPDGRIVDDPQGVGLPRISLPDAAASAPSYATLSVDSVPVRVFLLPVNGPEGNHAILVAGESLLPQEQALQSLILALVASGLVGLLLSLGGAWFLVGRSLVPIRRAFSRQQEFAADAAHELRTPLTVLRAATDVLDRHRDEPLAGNAQLFDDARHEIVRLERLAGDLLTLARSDLGELGLAVGEVDLATLAAQMVRRLAPLAEEHGIALSGAGAGPLTVVADPDRLQQVLLILLDNAIKYTPAGGRVTVRVAQEGGLAVAEVADSGEGISAEHLARLFDRFYRVDASRARAGGAGLGLAIARALIAAHGGDLSLLSAPGQGTTARVRLPLAGRTPRFGHRFGHLAARLIQRPARGPR